MTKGQKLIWVKIVHTLIWLMFNVVLFYLAYAVAMDRIGTLFWLGLASIGVECVVLLLFKNICPLTIVARQFSDSIEDNFDIYLPLWLAKYNKQIYGGLLGLILLGLMFRLFK